MMKCSLASCVVIRAQLVHSLEQLVAVDERTGQQQQGAENIPTPECAGAETVSDAAAAQLIVDAGAEPVIPDQCADTQREGSHQKQQQAVMHGLLAVKAVGDDVDISRNAGEQDDTVNAEGDQIQQYQLQQAAVGS